MLQGTQVVFAMARVPFTLLFTGLGFFGAVEHFRKDRASWWYLFSLMGILSLALVYYLNFKYGFSLASPEGSAAGHEVRERDYFFIVSFSVWGLWAGMGIAALWRRFATRAGVGYKKAAPVLALALIPLVLNFSWAKRSGDYSARDWAYNLLMSVEPYGVLFTNGDNDTFPLWYLQEVEGIRQDVTVIVTSYLNIDWYAYQLRTLTTPCAEGQDPAADPTRIVCQRPYGESGSPGAEYVTASQAADLEAAGKVPLIMHAPVRAPTRSILPLDDATIDQVAQSVVPVREEWSVDLGGQVTARLREGTYLQPWQQFALAILNNSIGDRPIYFASSGNAATQLGLQPYLVRQGLAFRLNEGVPDPARDEGIVELALSPFSSVTGIWMDEERTKTLASQVFVHRNGLPEGQELWPYRAVLGIPSYYSWVHYALYQAALADDRTREAEEDFALAEAWAKLAN
jgi:hypothetical protein